MTRKDYELIAAVVRDTTCEDDEHRELAWRFVRRIEGADNPRFDRGKFLAACGCS